MLLNIRFLGIFDSQILGEMALQNTKKQNAYVFSDKNTWIYGCQTCPKCH